VQENLRKLHVHTTGTQVSCSRKWIVQSAAEFHHRNLPEIEHVLFLPVSGTSFLCQKMAPETPFTPARNLRQKLAPENCQFERGFTKLNGGLSLQVFTI